MKKLISISIFMVFVAILSSCSSHPKTPTDVVDVYMSAMQNRQYEKIRDLIYVEPGMSAEVEKEMKDMHMNMLGEKASRVIDSAGGITSYENLAEHIYDEETPPQEAIVITKVTYGSGQSQEQNTRLLKAEDGKWYIALSK